MESLLFGLAAAREVVGLCSPLLSSLRTRNVHGVCRQRESKFLQQLKRRKPLGV